MTSSLHIIVENARFTLTQRKIRQNNNLAIPLYYVVEDIITFTEVLLKKCEKFLCARNFVKWIFREINYIY